MSDFTVQLHPQQLAVYEANARFKVLVAGRRWGKSRLAMYMLIIEALKSKKEDVFYIAPTFDQARRILWRDLKNLAGNLVDWTHENTATMRLINGVQIQLAGSDRPDSLRGIAMHFVCLDEYSAMKPFVWEVICRPALIDSKGSALFISTPQGKNHLYDLFCFAQKQDDWATFQYQTKDNPFLDALEVKQSFGSLSTQVARQELEASFESFNAGIFKEEWIRYGDEPSEGEWFVVADLAGFEATSTGRGVSTARLDETAIWAVKVHENGWFCGELEHGRWNVRETALRLLRLGQEKQARCIAIERGALMNAVMPYLEDRMRKVGYFPRIEPVSHGGKSKVDRVVWSLQGRFERGMITLREADWNRAFVNQLVSFPDKLSHDDLVDALAYTSAVAFAPVTQNFEDDYEPFDLVSGY